MNSFKNTAAIQSEQLRQLFSVSNVSLATSIFLAAILAYVQREAVAPAIVIGWFLIVVLFALLRAVTTFAYQRRHETGSAATRLWLFRFRLGVLVSGITWGLAGFLLFPAGDPPHQMFLVFMLAGLTAGSLVSYSVDSHSAIAYSVAALVPIIVRLFTEGDHVFSAMGMAVILYLSFMIVSLRQINRNTYENIVLRLEAAEREKELSISATAFEAQEGIIVTDSNALILKINQAFTLITGYGPEDVIGKHPCLLNADQHPENTTVRIWENLKSLDKWEGEVWNQRKDAQIYPAYLTISPVKDQNDTISNYVVTFTDITLRKAAEEEIKSLAFYDPLTGLPNRRLLQDRIQHAIATSFRSGREAALLLIDLDNFKSLNDTMGHDLGDLLLQQVAQRLLSCVNEGDTVARLGGDEFVVLLEDLSTQPLEAAEQTEALGERILTSLNQPYLLKQHEYHNTSSIGVAVFNQNHQAIDELFKQADIAMYQAKKAGRNKLLFFDQNMQDSISARAAMENELRKAIDKQQLHIYYQIQINDKGQPVGAEALMRWRHPEYGMILPSLFIPLAEETGMIINIGKWVLEQACAQLKNWERDMYSQNLALSINISALQFQQSNFVNQIRTVVQHYAINPRRLKIELTESLLLEDIESIIETMRALQEFGIQFSLDDFGTGYSSLQYLKRLPLQQLKIDQSFVRDIATDPGDQAIVRTIIVMAENLGLSVIAEGVNTPEQQQCLFKKGCKNYQGYLFGKPLPIEEFDDLLKQIGH